MCGEEEENQEGNNNSFFSSAFHSQKLVSPPTMVARIESDNMIGFSEEKTNKHTPEQKSAQNQTRVQ